MHEVGFSFSFSFDVFMEHIRLDNGQSAFEFCVFIMFLDGTFFGIGLPGWGSWE
jgi:hypothetical protein